MIRPFTDDDADAWVALMAESFANPASAVRAMVSAGPGQRLVASAEDGGGLAGAGEVDRATGTTPRLRIAVVPDRRGRGLGRALADALAYDGPALTSVRDDDPRSRRFAERLGFVVREHSEGYVLDLEATPPRDSPVDGPWVDWPTAYLAFLACCADTPDMHGEVPDYDTWRRLVGPPELSIVVHDDAEPVACCFAVPESADTWRITMTGVAPACRGQGLARAVKVALEARARAAGVRYLRTNNLADNEPINALNRALGYAPTLGVWRLAR